ncbi:NAD(P)/FAD-dependent oxidoreductase [bacterium]|nr:NAD(P)/FAD-dependent oxidoreductase [bacterium]
MNKADVIIVGGGAAGLFCAITAAKRGKKAIVLEHNERIGKKILISGGGRCNFTNTGATPKNYLSQNPSFCISALSRFTPANFLELIHKHHIDYFEKKDGQLFCQTSSKLIVEMLENECHDAGVTVMTGIEINTITKPDSFFIKTKNEYFKADKIVIACGGLSLKKLGATPFGYIVAKDFGHTLIPSRAGLVPLTWNQSDFKKYTALAGISTPVRGTVNKQSFEESLLFTHKGLSGPALLQISSYWNEGDTVEIDFLPQEKWDTLITQARTAHARQTVKNWLKSFFPERLAEVFNNELALSKNLADLNKADMEKLQNFLTRFPFKPMGTEGYTTAEVTLGGVDTTELSSKTMESLKTSGLYFIGEVVDVTGWLGGYNFQWAWASGFAAGNAV